VAPFNYRNENYRDELIKFAYPFSELSELETPELYIGTDLVLDASLFFKEAVELPVHIGTVDGAAGTTEQFMLYLADASGTTVASCLVTPDDAVNEVSNNDGVRCGLLVFNPEAAMRFSGSVAGRLFSLLPDVAAFQPEVTHVSRTDHLRYIRADAQGVSGTVSLVARHGLYFSLVDGVLALNVVADYPTGDGTVPVLSVNQVANASIWLANHPQLNLRIDSSGNQLRFVHVRDEK
jgi:hypothetical protein